MVSKICMLEHLKLGLVIGGSLHYVITHSNIWANQKTESFVYCTHDIFDVTCFPTFVRASFQVFYQYVKYECVKGRYAHMIYLM